MITEEQYHYMAHKLRHGRTLAPLPVPYPFNDGHVPQHRRCQETAMHLETNHGLSAQIGIQWLDKDGLLYPWPHVVNWQDDNLLDFSASIQEPKIGFTLCGNDVDMMNNLTGAFVGSNYREQFSADPLMVKIHGEWFEKLKHEFGGER